MKVTITREEFLRALDAVALAVPSKSSMPVLSYVHIETADDAIKLRGTDLAVMIADKARATIHESGVVVLPAATLEGWLKLQDASALIDMSVTDKRTTLKAGRAESKYSQGNAADFPPLPSIGNDAVRIELDAKAFGLALGEVLVAAASKLTRPEQTALYMHTNGKNLEMATTDGFRLATTTIADVVGGEGAWEALLPADAMQDVQKMLKDATGRVSIAIGKSWSMVDIGPGGTVLYTRLIEGKFPHYRRVLDRLDADAKSVLEVERATLQRATRVSMLFGEGEAKPIRLATTETGWLDLHGLGDDHQSHEAVAADFYKGDGLTLKLNGVYLKDALDSLPDTRVVLSNAGPNQPLLVRPSESTATTHLIMAMVDRE